VAAPALPRDVAKLREQLIVDQAPSVRRRSQYFELSSFVSRYGRPYSSRRLPINTLDEMRGDALLRFAQLVSLVPIFTGKWKIECTNPRKAQFIDHALRRIIGRLIMQLFESWNFGFQTLVKEFVLLNPGWQFVDRDSEGGPKLVSVWDGGPEVPALIWDPFVPLPPRAVAPVWTSGGDFNGIALSKSGVGAYGVPTVPVAPGDIIDIPVDINATFNDPDQTNQKIDVQHSLWVVNERDSQWGSVWGRSRLSYAFKYWWSYEMTLGILNRSVERKGDPTIVVSYPPGSSRVGDREVPNQDIAMQIGEAGRSGSILTVPSDVWGDDMATANTAPKWSITYLKAEEKFDELTKVLSYLDTMKIRSMMISELSAFEGAGGTSSRNVAATTGERSYEAQIFTQVEWDEIINRYMIPQLADANFPELADVPARKVTQAFGEDESNLAADLIRSMANANPAMLPVDWSAALERLQIDRLQGEALAEWEKNLIKQAEQSQPPPTPAQPNGAAGVTDTGFYYAAPDHISLEGDEAMLAALPNTKHYSDRAVLAQTRLVRKLWFDQLSVQYEDFAKHVEQADLSLAEAPEKVQKLAERVVKAWRFTSSTYPKAIKATAVALGKILARAGGLELASSRIDSKGWDPSSKALDEWVRENAAALVRSVDETTRKQLSAFLASELQAGHDAETIAINLRAHFASFPAWRADLIAREETKRYYNAGTLFAAEAVKAKQVQALDAQAGPTDADCVRRHGRVFPIADAWRESESEHVRGTLSWRILPAGVQLSFKRQAQNEMGDVAARFDQQESTIYLAEDIDPATEGRYLERAVDWLIGS
jgi:hypothetical protein